mgnify:CR=1 FL=1
MPFETSQTLLARLLKLCTLSYFSSFSSFGESSEPRGILAYLQSIVSGNGDSATMNAHTMFHDLYSDETNGVRDMVLALLKEGQSGAGTEEKDEIFKLKFYPAYSSNINVNSVCMYTDIVDENGKIIRKVSYICGGSYSPSYYDTNGDG